MKRPTLLLGLLLAVLTGMRLWLASTEEWTANEAYLYLVSQHLNWAYFDGPSGLPALMRLSELFFGNSPLALRLPSVIFSLLATIAALWAGRGFYSWSAGFWAAIAINLLPIFNLASLRATELLPVLTFWLLFAGFSVRAIHQSHWRNWLGAGITGAIGLLFSYGFLLAALALPLAAATSHKTRATFRRPGIYLALTFMLIGGATGPLIWNDQQDWISFSGQTLLLLRTFAGTDSVNSAGQLFLTLAGLPLIGLIAALVWAGSLSKLHPRPRLTLVFAGLPTLAVAYAIFRGHNAELFALPAVSIASLFLANQFMAPADLARRFPGCSRASIAAVLLLSLGVTTLQLFALVRTQSEPPWGALEDRLERALTLNQPAGARPIFFIAGDRNLASGLGFFLITERKNLRDFPPIYLRESQDTANQFGLWPRYDEVIQGALPADPVYTEEKGTNPNLGRAALYIGYEAPDDLPQTIKAGFEKVSALEKIEVTDGESLYLYLCENYQMAPL